MKTMLRLLGGIVLAGLFTAPAEAQFNGPSPGGSSAPTFQTGAFLPSLGQVWVTGSGADRGLGYEGSYATVGGLMPLKQGIIDEWYYIEGQAHYSENGNFFSNIGGGVRWYDPVLDFVVGVSGFYDYDDDQYEVFGHTFHQAGISSMLINSFAEGRINYYIPVGDNNFGPTDNCFQGNNIIIPGLDSALEGVDGELGGYVPGAEAWATRVFMGGYRYESDLVESFGGLKARIEAYPLDTVAVNLQVNHDVQFDTTAVCQVIFTPRGSRRYAAKERLFEPMTGHGRRNDHIVRVHRDPEIAIDPATGMPWFFVHVDNAENAPGAGTGTYEDPYGELEDADGAGSSPGDII